MKIIESLCLIFSFVGAMFFSKLKGKHDGKKEGIALMEKKYKEESIKIEKENEKIKKNITVSNDFDLDHGLLASKKRTTSNN